MSDPAIEAARRAWAVRGDESGEVTRLSVDAAREALAPIRDLHRPFVTNDPRSPHDVVCNHCLGPKVWPCATARLAYTTEELEQ